MGLVDLFKGSQIRELQKKIISLEDKLQSIRTQADLDAIYTDEGVVIPRVPFPYRRLYEFYKHSDILRIVIDTLTHETFRNGWEFEKKYEFKCTQCGREYDYKPKNGICENCGSNQLAEPDPDEITELEKTFKEGVNLNGQTLIDVLKQVDKDVNIFDDGYVLVLKDYFFNGEGKLIGAKVKEILRGNPQKIQIIADEQGRPARDEKGRIIKTCVEHRDRVWKNEDRCPICGKELFPAYFVAKKSKDKKVYYIKDECIHISKFNPSLTYGFSPIYAIWQKVVTLWNMDRYIRHYYEKERPPKALLLVNTRNEGALKKAWDWLINKTKQNPHMIYPLAIESDNKNFAQYLKLADTLTEMQFIEARNELRRTIGAIYGVMPLFQGDIQMSGGLNNEGLQVTVTNRAVERAQAIYNDKVFPFLMKQFGIDGWELRLVPAEQRDEMADLKLEAMKIQNARMMLDMGFNVELDEKGEFQYSGEAKKPRLELPMQQVNEPEQRFEGEPMDVHRGYIKKKKIYLKPGENAPQGKTVYVGPSGGRYYYSDEENNVDEVNAKLYEDYLSKPPLSLDTFRKLMQNWTSGADAESRDKAVELARYDEDLRNYLIADFISSLNRSGFFKKPIGMDEFKNMNLKVYRVGRLREGNNSFFLDRKQAEDYARRMGVEDVREYTARGKDIIPTLSGSGEIVVNSEDVNITQKEEDLLAKFLEKEIEEIEKQENANLIFKQKPSFLIEAMKQVLWDKVYEGFTKRKSREINNILLRGAAENWSEKRLMDELVRKFGMDEAQAEGIVRTEMHELKSKAREIAYKMADPEGEAKYKWINPLDSRTTKVCKELVERTKNGVTLDRLKELVKEVASKYGFKAREFTPHPNCRSTFIRVF